jgi:hypothetical protein
MADTLCSGTPETALALLSDPATDFLLAARDGQDAEGVCHLRYEGLGFTTEPNPPAALCLFRASCEGYA